MFEITVNNYDKAYDILDNSFIPAELKEKHLLRSQWVEKDIQIWGIEFNDTLAGVITVWEFEEFIFIENFAIKEELRGKGLGAKLLSDIINTYEKKRVILEVEPPENDTQKSRIRFYERNGFTISPYSYIQPPLREGCEDVALQIMHTGGNLTKSEFEYIKERVFTTVYNCI